MAMKMPKVLDCTVGECAYNKTMVCHAMAITVGGESPICDTFLNLTKKGGVMDMIAGVGACKEFDCMFNKSLECQSEGIHIAHHLGHAECETFSLR